MLRRGLAARAAGYLRLCARLFDDAATGQGLLNYFLRALNCSAIDLQDIEQTGLTPAEVELRSLRKSSWCGARVWAADETAPTRGRREHRCR